MSRNAKVSKSSPSASMGLERRKAVDGAVGFGMMGVASGFQAVEEFGIRCCIVGT